MQNYKKKQQASYNCVDYVFLNDYGEYKIGYDRYKIVKRGLFIRILVKFLASFGVLIYWEFIPMIKFYTLIR